jgi:hypothetical protein
MGSNDTTDLLAFLLLIWFVAISRHGHKRVLTSGTVRARGTIHWSDENKLQKKNLNLNKGPE